MNSLHTSYVENLERKDINQKDPGPAEGKQTANTPSEGHETNLDHSHDDPKKHTPIDHLAVATVPLPCDSEAKNLIERNPSHSKEKGTHHRGTASGPIVHGTLENNTIPANHPEDIKELVK